MKLAEMRMSGEVKVAVLFHNSGAVIQPSQLENTTTKKAIYTNLGSIYGIDGQKIFISHEGQEIVYQEGEEEQEEDDFMDEWRVKQKRERTG